MLFEKILLVFYIGNDTYYECGTAHLSSKDFPQFFLAAPLSPGFRKKLREIAALDTLSDFFATFGFLIPVALLRRRSSGSNSRQRRFTLHVTFWAFLAQTLAPETSCRDIVHKVQALWLLRAPESNAGSSSTAAYTKARQRLDPATIQGIGEHLIERLEARVQPSQLWLGRHVRVVDGTTVSMPDTPENQEKYPQPSSQKASCGFPRMRIHCNNLANSIYNVGASNSISVKSKSPSVWMCCAARLPPWWKKKS